MVLDPECQLRVAKKSFLEEGKKEEKSSQHNKIYTLKKRSEFLNLRRNCSTIHGKVTIGNYRFSSNKTSKVGLTVTKKIGSAVVRNRIKRVLRAVIQKNKKLFTKPINLEIIAKKEILKCKFEIVEKDIQKYLIK